MSDALPPPAERFARLIDGLCKVVAAHGAGAGIGWPLIGLLWSRLRRMADRFARLAARVAAGTPPAARRPAAPRPARPPPPHLPRGFAWLVRRLPQAAASASQLQHLLADPEMAALIAAAPRMGRILRPLCQMLGVPPPPSLRPPPPAVAPQGGPVRRAGTTPPRDAPTHPQRAGPSACGPPIPA